MKRLLFLVSLLSSFVTLTAQRLTKEQYIEAYKDLAIREMKRTGVPAAITLAQGILETENGNSDLFKKSNNHFGIKCKSDWTGPTVSHDDDAAGECFRVYKTAEESYMDHSNFLKAGTRYSFLFQYDPSDYKAWAYGLRKAGYATNPKYPEILIQNIENYNLQQYTLMALNNVASPTRTSYKENIVVAKPEPEVIAQSADDALVGTYKGSSKTVINGTKAVWALKGTSLLAIATEYEVSLPSLLEYNELTHDGFVEHDQYIFLERKPKTGDRESYVTPSAQSAYEVSQQLGIRLKNLCEYNGLKESQQIPAGTTLYLAPRGKTTAAKQVIPEGFKRVHQVAAKEGLYSIAKKYGVTVAEIKEWNNLQDDNVKVGQQLIVSK
jgi:LysM repeat protein